MTQNNQLYITNADNKTKLCLNICKRLIPTKQYKTIHVYLSKLIFPFINWILKDFLVSETDVITQLYYDAMERRYLDIKNELKSSLLIQNNFAKLFGSQNDAETKALDMFIDKYIKPSQYIQSHN